MTLKQDEVIRFTNLPTGTKYSIQEIYANKYPADNAGGKTDGRTPVADVSNLTEEGYQVEKVQHTGGTLSTDKTTVEGTVEVPDTRYYNQFTNKKVKEDKSTRAEVKVKKTVDDYIWGEEYYRFTLTPGTAEYSDSEGGTGISPCRTIHKTVWFRFIKQRQTTPFPLELFAIRDRVFIPIQFQNMITRRICRMFSLLRR